VERVVVFVCLHGAGKSRVAAALFDSAAPAGWRAISAGLEPQDGVSEHAARLLGADAERLDISAPKALRQVSGDLVVGIDCEVPGGRRWRLTAEWPETAVSDQLRARTAALVQELSA
jgi:hypothetical protein